jgi:hypothetical protein
MAAMRTSIAKGGPSIADENPHGANGLRVGSEGPTRQLSCRGPPLQWVYQRWDPSQSDNSNFVPHSSTHAVAGAQQHFFPDSAAHPVIVRNSKYSKICIIHFSNSIHTDNSIVTLLCPNP